LSPADGSGFLIVVFAALSRAGKDERMGDTVLVGSLLAILSGLMNGSFTLPMRFLGRWEWENVWSIFITSSCLIMPAAILTAIAPRSWAIIAHAPAHAVWIAIATGFAWGFGAIMFGQSVSAIGISLANTLVLAISSALGAFLPMLLLAPQKIFSPTGKMIVAGVPSNLSGSRSAAQPEGSASKRLASVPNAAISWDALVPWAWRCCWQRARACFRRFSTSGLLSRSRLPPMGATRGSLSFPART